MMCEMIGILVVILFSIFGLMEELKFVVLDQ